MSVTYRSPAAAHKTTSGVMMPASVVLVKTVLYASNPPSVGPSDDGDGVANWLGGGCSGLA